MTQRFKVGDHVSRNSEAGRVSGTIVAVRLAGTADLAARKGSALDPA